MTWEITSRGMIGGGLETSNSVSRDRVHCSGRRRVPDFEPQPSAENYHMIFTWTATPGCEFVPSYAYSRWSQDERIHQYHKAHLCISLFPHRNTSRYLLLQSAVPILTPSENPIQSASFHSYISKFKAISSSNANFAPSRGERQLE